MTYTLEDWRAAVTNLIKKTSKKEISWELTDVFSVDVWTEVDRSFSCDLKNRTYVVSATRKRHYLDEVEYYWEHGFSFSIHKFGLGGYIKLASAPEGLNAVESLFSLAEASYAYSQNALGDLLE